MTFGSILSATDPVAVAALLEVTGAPVRLKMHIAGESLLNDGSAIVFFTIFSLRYLAELDMLPEVGEEIDWPAGIKLFIRMAVGGFAVGILFGVMLLSALRLFTHNLNRHENVVEVASTITAAYLCYYTAEVVWGMSGVIATVTLGLMVAAGGRPLINDASLMEDFWTLVEHLLNTLLFLLGGLVWGTIIANTGDRTGNFTGEDWGYLVLLYIVLTAIRFALFAIVFPVISRIGLKSNWQEMVFQSFSGLRGAIGISLAIFLDNEVRQAEFGEENSKFVLQTNKVFGFVGGIAFMTLSINATLAGPLLRKLGLADSSKQREQVVECIRGHWRDQAVQDLIGLLTQRRFRRVNFATVRHHVFMLEDLSRNELMEAVDTYHHNNMHLPDYRAPKLENILPYVENDGEDYDGDFTPTIRMVEQHRQSSLVQGSIVAHATVKFRARAMKRRGAVTVDHETVLTTIELRRIFLDLLKGLYEHQIDNGELFEREFLAVSLQQSIDIAADAVSRGEVLRDWEFSKVINLPATTLVRQITNLPVIHSLLKRFTTTEQIVHNLQYEGMRVDVERCLSFLHAHSKAQEVFKREFIGSKFSAAHRTVLEESNSERRQAEALLEKYPAKEVEKVVSHKFCNILLNKGARYIENLNRTGLLKDREAEEVLEEIQHALQKVNSCIAEDHPGEISMTADDESSGKLDNSLYGIDEENEENEENEEKAQGSSVKGSGVGESDLQNK
jgi:NhaP-type Na+/H+ or K+/H+ antiporter